jgi:hypothetical protein
MAAIGAATIDAWLAELGMEPVDRGRIAMQINPSTPPARARIGGTLELLAHAVPIRPKERSRRT